MLHCALTLVLALATLAPAAGPSAGPVAQPDAGRADGVYVTDMEFALDQLEQKCGHFFKLKEIDWKAVRTEFLAQAQGVDGDAEHVLLMHRLLARLRDGHARLQPGTQGGELPWPEEMKSPRYSPGFSLCRVGKKVFIRTATKEAAEVGLAPGMEVVSVDEMKVAKWFEAELETYLDMTSCSTEQHGLASFMRWGFTRPEGARMKLEVKDGRVTKKKTITVGRFNGFNEGPAIVPADCAWVGKSLRWCRLPSGHGYINVRRIEDDILSEMDKALEQLQDVPGLILDFRGNSGGGCDHDALEARFVPRGKSMPRMARPELASQGPYPYAGPIVVIVDATVVSAGETTSGMFKEDGRAYMIGESATAGMSSQKETIQLPSGKLGLYVSVGSNRSSFNRGRGIEGIGVPPQEQLEYDPEELAKGVDTFIRRAEELLVKFPQKEVRYDPKDYVVGK